MTVAKKMKPTLHLEIAAILTANDNLWMSVDELAKRVNRRGQYKKKDLTPISPFQIHGRTRQYAHLFERDGSQVRLLGPVWPLPFSAFPERLADPIGRLAVAFACIEGRVFDLLDELAEEPPKVQAISRQLTRVNELIEASTFDSTERERLKILTENVRKVSDRRNAIMHSSSHGFDKRNGDAMLYSAKKNESVWVNAQSLSALTSWMYRILKAFDQRHFGCENWHYDLATFSPEMNHGLPS